MVKSKSKLVIFSVCEYVILNNVFSLEILELSLSINAPAGNFLIILITEALILLFNEPNNETEASFFDDLNLISFFLFSDV